ncbi:MAG: glutamate-5-semialdehyde dehydrogenase [Spirochaetaceae bacterium]|jgi:glutamate-5-semialdehyde dehydrogenase|nr:glutamate-5-semialdehyde dehydrogenase [Spirochaetaceae bacterium]
MNFNQTCAELRKAAETLAQRTGAQKNAALESAAQSLEASAEAILRANRADLRRARDGDMKDALLDRLALNEDRLAGAVRGVRVVIAQKDPVGTVEAGWRLPNGLEVRRVRVPLGVGAIIYESRPAVTVDAFALAYKSGNGILLRGSSAALESNRAIAAAITEGLARCPEGVPGAVRLLDSGDRSEVDAVLNARGLIDVVLPRGGPELINMVVNNARIPVIETGSGVCHLFVDQSADIAMAVAVAENGKLQRPGVCNALETLVVHRDALSSFLPALEERFAGRAELRCDEESFAVLQGRPRVVKAAQGDFGTEFLDTILAVKTVSGIDEAIGFINTHNTKHSDSIITRSVENARSFQQRIDSACVYVNASTRFTDGGEFGFGAELGISTQKLHVRGPMGLEALTTTKYLLEGDGQVR